MNQTICVAINGQHLLRFYYDLGWRTVEPHAHGMSTAGNEVLRAFQTQDVSAPGEPVNWKLFRVDWISNLEWLEATFSEPRPGYKRGDPQMTQIYCEL